MAVRYQVNISTPAWSPDGRRIAFVRGKGGNDVDGKHQRRLTRHPASDAFPAWSPDGKRIALLSTRPGQTEVYVMRADGSRVHRLTYG